MKKILLLLFLISSVLFAQEYHEGEFIGIGWDNSSGKFNIGIPNPDDTLNPVQLTSGNYRYGGNTSKFNVYLDGTVYTNDPEAASVIPGLEELPYPTVSLTSIGFLTEWEIGDFYIMQQVRVQDFEEDSAGAVIIEYIIANQGDEPAEVGVLKVIDTRVAGHDDVPIVFPDGTAYEDSIRYFRDEDVPEYWIESPFDEDSIYAAICDLSAGPHSRPDRIMITDDREALNIVWRPEATVGRIEGTAVIMWWDYDSLNPLPAGESKIVQFPFGTATGSATDGAIAVRHVMPTNISVIDCGYIPSRFNLNYTAFNRTIFRMRDMSAELHLPTGVFTGMEPIHDIDDWITAGGIRTGFWELQIDARPTENTEYPIEVVFEAEIESLYTHPDSTIDTTYLLKTTTIYDTINVPGSDFMPPEYELVLPFFGARSSLPDQEVLIYADDPDAGVDIHNVDAYLMQGPTRIDMRPDTTLFLRNRDTLVMVSDSAYRDGDQIYIICNGMGDLHGCYNASDSILSYFRIDRTGPIIGDYWPPDDSVCNDSLIAPYIEIYDNMGEVDPWSARVEITDDYTTSNYYGYDLPDFVEIDTLTDEEDDDILLFQLADIGERYPDGRVDFVLEEVADSIHYGPPNLAPDCPVSWWFHINAHGPQTRADLPKNGWYSSNNNQDVRFYLYDGNGILPESVEYTIDGIELGYDDVEHTDDSLHTYSPPGVWESGYVVEVEFIAAMDTFETPLDTRTETNYSFTIDLDAPVMESIEPADDAALPSWRFSSTIELSDELAGLCHHNATVTIDGDMEYSIDDGALYWIDDTHLTFVNDSTGFRPEIGDEIELCFNITDSVHVGEFNASEFCVTYYYDPSGPEVEFLNTSGYLCMADSPIEILITDPDGVSRSTIEVALGNEDTLSISSPSLTFEESLLTYTPETDYAECDSIIFCVLAAADIHSNWATGLPLCYTYRVDIEAPEVTALDTYFVGDLVQNWFIDGCSGIIESTLVVTVDSDEFYGEDDCITIWDDSLIVFNSASTDLEFVEDRETWYEVTLYYESICGDIIEVVSNMNWAIDENESNMLPSQVILHQNVPNPFNAATSIRYEVPEKMHVELSIHDAEGRRIANLYNGIAEAGINQLVWDGKDDYGRTQTSGYYIYRIVTENHLEAKGMFLLK